jgi:hypothetical protein
MFERNTTPCRISRPFAVFATCLVVVSIYGCSPKIDCDAAGTKTDVLTSIQQAIGATADFQETRLAMSGQAALLGAKLIASDGDSIQATCQADYVFIYNGKQRRIPVSYQVPPQSQDKAFDIKIDMEGVTTRFMELVIKEPAIKNGLVQRTDPDSGKVVETKQYKDDQLVASKTWSSDGKTLLSDMRWTNGKANGFENNQHGDLRVHSVYKDGSENRKTYDTTGASEILISEGNFKDDKADGMQRDFRQGELFIESLYKDGKYLSSVGNPEAIEELENVIFDNCVLEKEQDYRGDRESDGSVTEAISEGWARECMR